MLKTLMRFSGMTALMTALMITVVGCSSPTESESGSANTQTTDGDTELTIVENQSPSEEQKSQMLAAKDALFQKLSGRLMEAMGQGGAESAISICKSEAIELTQQIGDEYGLSIGRTGVRLRNSNNQAPSWAKPLTDEKLAEPKFVTLSNGSSAALLPIKLQPQCVMCHGPEDQIAPSIKNRLASLYPNDAATGFEVGELRGWFWIEMLN